MRNTSTAYQPREDNLRYDQDAEANDMIHKGSDHRCVMATFTITTLGKSGHYKTLKGKQDIIEHEGSDQTGKNIEVEKHELGKKDTKRSSKKFKKTTATKKQQHKQKAKMQKHKQKMKMQQQKQKAKILKRKQKKSKESAQEPW